MSPWRWLITVAPGSLKIFPVDTKLIFKLFKILAHKYKSIAIFSDELVVKWANQTVLSTLLIFRELTNYQDTHTWIFKVENKTIALFYFGIQF